MIMVLISMKIKLNNKLNKLAINKNEIKRKKKIK